MGLWRYNSLEFKSLRCVLIETGNRSNTIDFDKLGVQSSPYRAPLYALFFFILFLSYLLFVGEDHVCVFCFFVCARVYVCNNDSMTSFTQTLTT